MSDHTFDRWRQRVLRRRREAREGTTTVTFRLALDEEGRQVRLRHVRRFLREGRAVLVTVRFRDGQRDEAVRRCRDIVAWCADWGVATGDADVGRRQVRTLLVPFESDAPVD